MSEKPERFKRVHFDGEEDVVPKLYERNYTASGKQRSAYYAVFVDWKGKRRKFPLGKKLKRAIQKIYEIDKKNHNEVDFDDQKEKRAAREMTFSKFVE
jgi:hypothetical protein